MKIKECTKCGGCSAISKKDEADKGPLLFCLNHNCGGVLKEIGDELPF